MTKERMEEIIKKGSKWVEYRKHMTKEEIEEVMVKWNTMPGYTCFYDALVKLQKGE